MLGRQRFLLAGLGTEELNPFELIETDLRRDAPRSHSFSFDHRRRPETLRTAMATAFL
jgi:hypothetical protein